MNPSFIAWLVKGVSIVSVMTCVHAQEVPLRSASASPDAIPPRRQLPPRDPAMVSAEETPQAKARKALNTLPTELPPLPEGVTELKFGEMFRTPIGERGLELTEKLQALNGKRVRVLGFMVYESTSDCTSCVRAPEPVAPVKKRRIGVPALSGCVVPGRMLLTPGTVTLNHSHYGLADDLPPQTIFVEVPDKRFETVPYTPGPMLLTGVLEVGNAQEPDGRMSIARLVLDRPAPVEADAEAAASVNANASLTPVSGAASSFEGRLGQ